jgi:hypothetical protein
MLKFLKMMVAEDVINGRSSGGGFGGGRVLLKRRFCTKRGSGGGRSDRNSAPRRWLESSAPREGGFGGRSSTSGRFFRQSSKTFSLVTHLDQEDQEETNIYC